MSEPILFIDSTVFLGMHHEDEHTRCRSLAFFQHHFDSLQVHMNYEQIGICDAVIWTQSREVQDSYYPFMDRLHTDMKIRRAGYTFAELQWALSHRAELGLRPEQALLVAQVVLRNGQLVTNDPALLQAPILASHLWHQSDLKALPPFPPELSVLYEASKCFTHRDKELANV